MELIAQRGAFNMLHHIIEEARGGDAEIGNSNDIRVLNGSGGARFLNEAIGGFGIAAGKFWQDRLNGEETAQMHMCGAIYRTHATAADTDIKMILGIDETSARQGLNQRLAIMRTTSRAILVTPITVGALFHRMQLSA